MKLRLLPSLIAAQALALTCTFGASTGALAQTAQAAEAPFVKGRVIVHARAGLPDQAVAAILSAHGAKAQRIGKTDLHVVQLPAGASETAMRNILARNPHFRSVQLDRQMKVAAAANDPLAPNAWHLNNIGAPAAWDSAMGAGVTIAILDTGIESTHPDLASQIVPGWNAVDGNSNTADAVGHGTAVAGAAAATLNNGTGVASVAGKARIMAVRVVDSSGWASSSTIARGLTWAADNGARVANISISNVPGDSTIQTAARYMKSKGGLVVVAAGNGSTNLGSWDETNMIVVSATESNDTLASWSNFGGPIRVAAPGNYIWSTDLGGSYAQWWGTSFSSPVAAGVVALIMSARPGLTPAQVEGVLTSSATDLGAAGRDAQYGFGKVNAAAAVAAALALVADTTAPQAAIASPTTGATVSGLVTVDASASDNQGVARVELLVNGTLVATDTSGPYQFSWDSTKVANGTHRLEAVAYDGAGNSTRSAAVSVSVSNVTVVDTTPPTVAIVNPSNGSSVTGTVSIGVNANDNGGVASVKNTLLINGVVVASGTGGSLNYKWNTRKVRSGTHTIQAVSQDGAGNRSSASVQVVR